MQASAAGVCLTDPSVYSGQFDLDLCPSLLKMLHALDAGETEYPVDCEPACADNFYTVSVGWPGQMHPPAHLPVPAQRMWRCALLPTPPRSTTHLPAVSRINCTLRPSARLARPPGFTVSLCP